jgi:hypothetical protein
MVHVTEPWDAGPQACTSWRVLPLLVLEALLLVAVLWRLVHHCYWQSHPRRVFFHGVLLASSGLRWVFWLSLCHVAPLFGVGAAALVWANSLLLLCTASIIVQWWCAVSAGRVAVRELQKAKQFALTHPLVLLHLVHLACAAVVGALAIHDGIHSAQELRGALEKRRLLLLLVRVLNMVTVLIDAVLAVVVARKLRARLLAAAMADDMKHKSVRQMTLLIVALTAALVLQAVMDLPIVVTNSMERGFGKLSFTVYAIVTYFVPAVLLSGAFLYIMRRVEQREPVVRLVVQPTASSLVEYEECASPCMWCEHHRRYQVGQTKWDVNLMTSISPRTVDSNFRGVAMMEAYAAGGHAHGHGGHRHPHRPHGGHHAHGGPPYGRISVLGGDGGTFPTELETPMGWASTAVGDDFPVLSPPTPPTRTYSGRRIDAGLLPSQHEQLHHPPHHHSPLQQPVAAPRSHRHHTRPPTSRARRHHGHTPSVV